MITRSTVIVAAGGRLEHLDCRPPLTVRQVHPSGPDVCALCLVGSAAGPLAGDVLELDITVRPDARATLDSTGASIAQGGGGTRTVRTAARLGAGAELVARPQPVVVARDSRLDVEVSIDLQDAASVRWDELIVLGRTGEDGGTATLRWDVTRSGRPVLRQFVDLADPVLRAWRGTVGGRRVIATALLSGPTLAARTVVASPYAVAAALDDHTVLLTVLGDDVAHVRADLATLADSRVETPPRATAGR